MNSSRLKATIGALALAVWCLIGALVMIVAKTFRLQLAHRFPLFFHGAVARLFSLKVEYEGVLESSRPTVYASNHVSYLDVFVLGAKVEGAFVAKSEVAGWPVFGKLAQLQNTVFLERRAQRAKAQVGILRRHLDEQSNLILFPEGTSTSGTYVAPFRSSLFAATEGVQVQPITIAYVDYCGQPMDQEQRDSYAWYLPDPDKPIPNKPFAAHFFEGLGLRTCGIKVIFHPPVAAEVGDRKQIAALCEERVRTGLETYLGKAVADCGGVVADDSKHPTAA